MTQLPVSVTNQLDADLALKGLSKDRDWLAKLGWGGTITAVAALVAGASELKSLPLLLVSTALGSLTTGFVIRTMRMRLKDPDAKITEWNKWQGLLIPGLMWLAIQFCWAIVTAMILTTGISLAYFAVVRGQANGFLIGELAMLFTLFVLGWASIFTSYLMVNFAQEEKLTSGFALRKVIRGLRQNPKTMYTAWALACAVQLCGLLGTAVTVIGVFLSPYVFFAAQIVATTILTQAWRATWPDDYRY